MKRKDEHLKLALQYNQQARQNDFDELRFIHHALPVAGTNIDTVDISSTLGPLHLSSPFYINAMTGGSTLAYDVNKKLGQVAAELDIMLALGSASAGLSDDTQKESYRIARKMNPNGFMWLNLSADASLEKVYAAQDVFQADGLQLHLNLPQEIVMPEGDRAFDHWLENIAHIKQHLNIPVMVKETGFGMSLETIQLLKQAGISIIDISGSGGTSFTAIENSRRQAHDFNYLADFGLSTVESLLEAQPFTSTLSICASGGVRHPLDIVKCLALGAKAVGISGLLLPTLLKEPVETTIELLTSFKTQLPALYALLGAKKTADLTQTDLILSEKLLSYADQRHLELDNFGVRSYLIGRYAK